jgi:hypothetical protein
MFVSKYLCISMIGAIIGCRQPVPTPSETQQPNNDHWTSIPYGLDGDTEITRSIAPDIPLLGGKGKDSYSFKGLIKFEVKNSISINIQTEPQGLFYFEGQYYLVTQGFFKCSSFHIFRFTVNNPILVTVSYADIPQGFCGIMLSNPYSSRSFKIWNLEQIRQYQGIEASFRQFMQYLHKEPRCLLRLRTDSHNVDELRKASAGIFVGYDSMVEVYINNITIPSDRDKLYDRLLDVLHNTNSKDRADEIRDLCFSLHTLNPERAIRDINQFWADIEKEQVQNDGRLMYRDWIIKYFNGARSF